MHHVSAGGFKSRVVAILEVIATEAPELLAYQIEICRQGPVVWAIEELAMDWRIRPDQMCATVAASVAAVEKLRRRRSWRDPAAVVDRPNLATCRAMAQARAARTNSRAQRGQLEATCRRLAACLETQRRRDWLLAFLDETSPPAGDWIHKYVCSLSHQS